MLPTCKAGDIARPTSWDPDKIGRPWHHIIPRSLLARVCDRLVAFHIESELPAARVALRQFLLLCDPRLDPLESRIDRMRAENTTQRRNSLQQLEPLSVSDWNALYTAAVWPSWDVVEGPWTRIDDPGDDYMDRFYHGLQAGEEERMRTIDALYDAFLIFLGSGPTASASSVQSLSQAVQVARLTLAGKGPIRYREEMWVPVSGSWQKRRHSV